MNRLSDFIVRKRNVLLVCSLVLCALCAFLALRVPINTDMTKYLPDTSPMKQGIDLMEEEFASLQMPATIRVMLRDPKENEADVFAGRLGKIENVSAVSSGGSAADANGHTCLLFTVSTAYDYQSSEELKIESDIRSLRGEGYDLEMVNDNAAGMQIPLMVYALAVALLLAVLFAMCASWVEPFLFLAAIGIAIVLNLGTNIVLGSVSQTTYSMSAVLQLVLSMDYSVILMNRYRQEKSALAKQELPGEGQDRAGRTAMLEQAMRKAWLAAFPSVTSSGFTTFVGLIMLVFMRFKIGKDLGLVLAKGVLLSMVCVLTVLPALILLFDGAVERTAKKVLHIPTGVLSRLSWRLRIPLTAGFVVLFGVFWYTQGLSETSYSLSSKDPIAEVFPPANPVVLLYDNADEEAACALAADLGKEAGVTQVFSYGNVLGRKMSAPEMTDYIREMAQGEFSSFLDMGGAGSPVDAAASENAALSQENLQDMVSGLTPEMMTAIYGLYALQNGGNDSAALSLEQIFTFVSDNLENPLLAAFADSSLKERIGEMSDLLSGAKDMLVGPTHSLMMIATTLRVESAQTEEFITGLSKRLEENMTGTYYLIGNSPMNVEMKGSFDRELLLITLLTAAAIFIVVAVTFRQLLIPVLLVALVQCGVFMTITTTWLLGYKMYFLAIIIVQCILMGATVDYGILMTSYYREIRRSKEPQETLAETYRKSVHTVLTSGLFMIFVTGALGLSPVEPTIGQICQSIALGALSATLLVLFMLPGMLSALDRWVKK